MLQMETGENLILFKDFLDSYSRKTLEPKLLKALIVEKIVRSQAYKKHTDLPCYEIDLGKRKVGCLAFPETLLESWGDHLAAHHNLRPQYLIKNKYPIIMGRRKHFKGVRDMLFFDKGCQLKKDDEALRELIGDVMDGKYDRFVCVDLEAKSVGDTTHITEIGISVYYISSKIFESRHIIVADKIGVKTSRKKLVLKFAHGESIFLKTDAAIGYLCNLMASDERTVLVGHSFENDIEFLESAIQTIDTTQWKNGNFWEDVPLLDTQIVFNTKNKPLSLTNVAKRLKLDFDEEILHNAGNDAHLTLRCLIRMLGFE